MAEKKKGFTILIISLILTAIMMTVFGIVFGPIYILWTFLGSFAVNIVFFIQIMVGLKKPNLGFAAVMIIGRLIVYALIIFLVGYLSHYEILAFIVLAAGFTSLFAAIPISLFFTKEKKESKKEIEDETRV